MLKENSLTRAEIEHYRQKLLERRAEIAGNIDDLLAELKHDVGPGAASPSLPTHMSEAGTDEEGRQKVLGLLQHDRDILLQIDEAIERIRAGTYGQCQLDGQPISRQRLEAKPWARFCKDHAETQQER